MTQKMVETTAYLLRLWRARTKNKDVWRASLEDVSTRQKVGFASLDELFSFLRDHTSRVESEPE